MGRLHSQQGDRNNMARDGKLVGLKYKRLQRGHAQNLRDVPATTVSATADRHMPLESNDELPCRG
jgi:hypothetical protein